MNKAMINSYLRNLLGVVLALVVSQMQVQGVSSPIDLTQAGWLVVLNGVWAAAVPTLIRYLNTKDPAFGRVAKVVAKEVSTKITTAAKKAPAKKPVATKTTTKTTTKK